jgi:hypothetical protein
MRESAPQAVQENARMRYVREPLAERAGRAVDRRERYTRPPEREHVGEYVTIGLPLSRFSKRSGTFVK